MEDTVGRGDSGGREHAAQAAAVMGSMESEQPTQGVSMSADESMRINSELRFLGEETHQAADVGGSTSAGEPRRSEEDKASEEDGSDKEIDDGGIHDAPTDGSDQKSSAPG